MRRIARQPLTRTTQRFLAKRARSVADATDAVAEVDRLWRGGYLTNRAFDEVRSTLQRMAHSRARCMYCCDSAGSDIEHFRPKSQYPELAFSWSNYLWACSICNSNQKREQFPVDADGRPMLLDPTVDDPREHLAYLPANGVFVARSDRGEASIGVFALNDSSAGRNLPYGRLQAFSRLQSLLIDYGVLVAASRDEDARAKRAAMLDEPFCFLLFWLAETARRAPRLIDSRCVAVLQRNTDIRTWVD